MGSATGFWKFEEAEGGVRTTWGFKGDAGWDLPGRYAGLAMESMVGPYYESGLIKLKAIAEATPVPEPAAAAPEPEPADDPSGDESGG
jgi:hypothetical protein